MKKLKNLARKKLPVIGYTLYKGPSKIDGKPIVVILVLGESKNTKTGDMMQVYILKTNVNPVTAIRTGSDVSICGDCKHRPTIARKEGQAICYVNHGQGPLSTYNAFRRGRYEFASAEKIAQIVKDQNRGVRFGTYGDPCAAPIEIFQNLKRAALFTTGYTHTWRNQNFDWRWIDLLMLSCDNLLEEKEIEAMEVKLNRSIRYFRVAPNAEPPLKNEFICPSSFEGGRKVTCNVCRLCGGSDIKAKSVLIADHGLGSETRRLEMAVKREAKKQLTNVNQ